MLYQCSNRDNRFFNERFLFILLQEIPVRPHYFWPIFARDYNAGDKEGKDVNERSINELFKLLHCSAHGNCSGNNIKQ